MAVNCHQTKCLNLSTVTADRLASEDSASCSTHSPKSSDPSDHPPSHARKRRQPCAQVRRGKRAKRKVTYLVEIM